MMANDMVAWFVGCTCSAAADVREFPVVWTLLCSVTCYRYCLDLATSLAYICTYALGQFEQGML